ncbi:MAG: hypothetical protein IJ696_00310 [Ruminococcus sp.]|nr:hypothetical protein [Ruminococcus sp.]
MAHGDMNYSRNTYLTLHGTTRIENNTSGKDCKASSIYEKKSKADVKKDSTVYIVPGYHIG